MGRDTATAVDHTTVAHTLITVVQPIMVDRGITGIGIIATATTGKNAGHKKPGVIRAFFFS
jgi:hypothetical protein